MQMFTFDQGTIQAEARNWRARRSSSSATSARCVAVPCRRLNSASTTWRTHFRTDPHQQANPGRTSTDTTCLLIRGAGFESPAAHSADTRRRLLFPSSRTGRRRIFYRFFYR